MQHSDVFVLACTIIVMRQFIVPRSLMHNSEDYWNDFTCKATIYYPPIHPAAHVRLEQRRMVDGTVAISIFDRRRKVDACICGR